MEEQLSTIKDFINNGDVDRAIKELSLYIKTDAPHKDQAYYLRGNAYRKLGNWKLAVDNYLSAIELNPESPALQAKNQVMDILNFYNKDMFNH